MPTMTIKANSDRITGTITADAFTFKNKSVSKYQVIIVSNYKTCAASDCGEILTLSSCFTGDDSRSSTVVSAL